MRKAGILLPISSLPSRYGIGCFSREAREFIYFLRDSGQKYWQILPLGPTSFGDSPYQSFSTFAGNPYFIDPEYFVEKGYISQEELEEYNFGDSATDIDYERLYHQRFAMLRRGFDSWLAGGGAEDEGFAGFLSDNSSWIHDYSLFMAIKDANEGREWLLWETPLRLRDSEALKQAAARYEKDILFYSFCQYLFYIQWGQLKREANQNGIEIIGDLPIYVSMDSSDAWANPSLFQLDENCTPTGVAGVPPDYFSATGQLWGNPLYNWDYHRETGYAWWVERMKSALSLYDVVRIDHFRGFEAYYSVPFGHPTAEHGHWEPGPNYELFSVFKEKIGEELPIIAEDLGVITPEVRELIRKCGFPGMKILQFAFDSHNNDYLPHNHVLDCIVYTGTHDNNTTRGWFCGTSQEAKNFISRYTGFSEVNEENISDIMTKIALSSVAETAIIPIQDYLKLSSEGRINAPGTLGENWRWRMESDVLSKELADSIRELTKIYGRCQ